MTADKLAIDQETWQAAEMLTSPEKSIREKGLSYFQESDLPKQIPLLAYLLGILILDPDLEVRFHAVQILGRVLDGEQGCGSPARKVIEHLHGFLGGLTKEDLVKILEVSLHYLSAEENIIRILYLCSFAGGVLSGMVNDRKLNLDIRLKTIYFSGKVGFLETRGTLERLIERVERVQDSDQQGSRRTTQKMMEMKKLYPAAVTALDRLGINPSGDRKEQP